MNKLEEISQRLHSQQALIADEDAMAEEVLAAIPWEGKERRWLVPLRVAASVTAIVLAGLFVGLNTTPQNVVPVAQESFEIEQFQTPLPCSTEQASWQDLYACYRSAHKSFIDYSSFQNIH